MKSVKISFFLKSLVLMSFFNACYARPSIKAFFPGVNPILPKILEFINQEKKQIDFAQYTLLHPEVVSALRFAANRGVTISGVVDQNSIDQIGKHILLKDKHAQSSLELLNFLRKYDISIYASNGRVMHNKIMCFSQNADTNGPIVVTGSANYTVSGLNGVFDAQTKKDCSHNFENILVIQGYKKLYEQFKKEIDGIKIEVKRQQDKRIGKK